jgi:hypothetical protein
VWLEGLGKLKKSNDLKECLLEKSKLAQHAYEGDHNRVAWDKATNLEMESNSIYRKYKQSVHMAC